jgi:formate dehydrogenase assembly factor FdhD
MSEGVIKFELDEFRGGWQSLEGEVIEEGFVSIFVNGAELATIMSTPREQDRLALGFLCNEGLIDSLDDVRAVHICPSGVCVDVWLKRPDEDVGRHNTIDKLRGACLIEGIDPRGLLLLATGRISSEMINKAAKMGCPIVASRTSPTSMSVQLAREWNITLCGYVRRDSMRVYSHPERLKTEGG